MAEGSRKDMQADSPEICQELLNAVEETFRNGRVPENPVPSASPEIRKKLDAILSDIVSTQQFARALAQGDLSQDLPVLGRTAGCLKALQANLRHLTWQTGQIARGDLVQRVHFMGEFSDSFNAMVEHLADDVAGRVKREEELQKANAALAAEIAERKRAEDALCDSREMYRELVENISDVIFSVDSEGKFTYASPAIERRYGYKPDEVLGKPFLAFVHPDDRSLAAGAFRKRHEGEFGRNELRIVARDGRVEHVIVSQRPQTTGGAVTGFTYVLTDITARKRAEDELRESEKRYRDMFEINSAVMLLIDPENGRIVDANNAASRYYGYSREEIRDLPITRINIQDPETTRADLARAGSSEGAVFRFRHQKKTGEIRDTEVFSGPVTLGGRRLLHSIVHDVTDRAVAETALKESEFRFRELFNSMKSGVAVYRAVDEGSDFVFVDFNHGAEIIEQIDRERVINRKVTEVFAGIGDFGIMDVFRRVWRTGVPEHYPVSQYQDERIASWRENYVYRLPSGEIVAIYDDVTERMRAEEELQITHDRIQEHDRFLQRLIDTIPNPIFYKNREGRYIGCNTAFEAYIGFSRDRLIGKTAREIAPRDLADLYEVTDQKLFTNPGTQVYESRVRHADGSIHDVIFNKASFTDRSGNVDGLVGVILDITERKKFEDELRQSEERFRTLSETSLTGVYIFVDGRIRYVNPAFAHMYGYEPGEMIGMDPLTLVHPDDRAMVRDRMQARFDHQEEISVYECRMMTRDLRTLVVSIMGVLIPFEGRPAISGNLLDITERKRADEVLRESEERYRTLFDESPISLWEEDFSDIKYWFDTKRKEGVRDFRDYFDAHPGDLVSCAVMVRVTRINRATMILYGAHSAKEFSGGLSTIFTRESYDAFQEELIALSQGKTGYECEVPVQTLSGEQKITLLKLIVVPGFEQTLEKVFVSLLDITERKRMEDALRQANKKITMLSSITRHDIRNQLLALRGYLSLSRMKAGSPEVREFLERGERAAEAISSQIEFTKYYESIGVKAPEWQDIARLVLAARSQFPALEQITVTTDLPPVKIFADRLIEKVFYNLFENTLRHGREVTRIHISFRETDTGAEIVYEDNGGGISRDDKTHLFQKGFGKNTGLGLFLSREILAITNLAIREDGEPGKGVRFVISLPRDDYRITREPPAG